MDIDALRLNFSPESLYALNWVIGIIMFGVALDIHWRDFKEVFKQPRAPLIGLACQFVLLPAIACGLTMLLHLVMPLAPGIALGVILVAACPGGNFSNFLTHFSRGNTALSVTMSSISTLASIVMTPFNIGFWGRVNPQTAPLLKSIEIDPWSVLLTVFSILLMPLALGMLFRHFKPLWSDRLKKPFQSMSLVFLILIITLALKNNFTYFVQYIGLAATVVFIVNAVALALGYGMSRLTRLNQADSQAVAFEVGIQNAGFGLILIFNFFEGLGGMALITAWWGVWHLISGLALAIWWRKKSQFCSDSVLTAYFYNKLNLPVIPI